MSLVRRSFLMPTMGVVLLAGLTACSADDDAAEAPGADAPRGTAPVAVRVAVVGAADLSAPLEASGLLAAREEVALAFKIGGIVQSVSAQPGARVAAGALLARLTPTEIEAQVIKAQQAVAKAQRDAARARALQRDSVITLAQLQDAETGLAVAEQDLRIARFNQQYAEVRAPEGGVVLRRMAEPGALVGPGAPVVLFRPDGQGMVLRVALSDRDAARVRAGDSALVRFDAVEGRTFAGRVSRVAPGADPRSGTYDAEVDLERDARALASGLVGRVTLRPRGDAPQLAVPLPALVEADADSALVYVVDADGRTARVRRIRIGRPTGAQVAVLGGLTAGDRVVVAGGPYLTDGAPVRVSADAAPAREATP